MKSSQPFLVVALYENGGYYSSVIATTREELLKAVEVRTSKVKQLVACSVPFEGYWTSDGIPNVTLPPEWKEALSSLDKKRED